MGYQICQHSWRYRRIYTSIRDIRKKSNYAGNACLQMVIDSCLISCGLAFGIICAFDIMSGNCEMQCPRFLKSACVRRETINAYSAAVCADAVLTTFIVISAIPAKIPSIGNSLFIIPCLWERTHLRVSEIGCINIHRRYACAPCFRKGIIDAKTKISFTLVDNNIIDMTMIHVGKFMISNMSPHFSEFFLVFYLQKRAK